MFSPSKTYKGALLGRPPLLSITHISRARNEKRKENKWNRCHHNVPEIGGQLGKVHYRKGWILCGKARKRSVSFPEKCHRGCLLTGNTYRYALNLLEWGGGGAICHNPIVQSMESKGCFNFANGTIAGKDQCLLPCKILLLRRRMPWSHPRPPLECTRGPHARSHFTGKWGIFGPLSRKIAREN